MRSVDEVEDELAVSLRSGKAGVYDPARLAPFGDQRHGDLVDHAGLHGRVANDTLRRLGPPGLELRLDQHERLPTRRGEPQGGRQREADGDERDVARHELGRERQLGERAGIHTLEHGHPCVAPHAIVELAVADVEGDHTRCASLEQNVGEPAGRRADVEAVEPVDVDAEQVECVCELVPGARDVRRRRNHLELDVRRDLLARLGVSGDETCEHERLGLRARLGEPALDEHHVKPLLRHPTPIRAANRS